MNNNARTTIVWNPGASDLSFVCKTGEGALFPSVFPYFWVLEHYSSWVVTKREIVTVTWKTGDVFTITRASQECVQDESTIPKIRTQQAYSFVDWDFFSQYFTEEDLNNLNIKIEWEEKENWNCNTITTWWRYWLTWTPTNWPKTWEFALEVYTYDTNRIMQIATYLDSSIYTRYYNGSVWSTWVSSFWVLSSNIASATTTNLATATGNTIHITWTTTITWFWTVNTWAKFTLIFDWILTLTHNATSLILPTWANITTAVWDSLEIVSEWSWNWRVVDYQRKSWEALVASVVDKVKFWWTWSDWVLNISSWTTTLSLSNNFIEKNYSSMTISWTALLDITWVSWNNWAVALLRCKWNFSMTAWTIAMDWQWWAWWTWWASPTSWQQWYDINEILRSNFWLLWDWTWSASSGTWWLWWVWITKLHRWYDYGWYWWAWWGGWKPASWWNWWRWGWCLIIEVWWSITFTWWTIRANWSNWTAGWASTSWWGGWWGWTVVIFYNTLWSITWWTLQCNWWNWWAWNLASNQYWWWWGGWSYANWWRWGWTVVWTTWQSWSAWVNWAWWTWWASDWWWGGWWGYWAIFKNNYIA